MKRLFLPLLLAAMLMLGAGGCWSNTGEPREIAPSPPDTATHQLKNIFRVSRLSDSVTLSRVTDIQFLSGGNLVIDHAANSGRLLELDPSGNLLHIIGGAGREEGRFADISRFVVTPDDSMHVFEEQLTRQQVFARDTSGWRHKRTLDAERNLSDLFIADYPLAIYPSADQGYRAIFENEFFYSDTTHRFYRFIAETDVDLGYAGDRRLMRPVQDAVVTRTGSDLSVDWSTRFHAAFYRYRPTTGDVLYVTNTSPKIRLLGWDGGVRVSGLLPHEEVPLNRQAVQAYLDRISDTYPEERKQRIRARYLDHEPYFQQLFLDGNRIWVRLSRSDPEAPEWLVTDLEGNIHTAFRHPDNFEALGVHNGRLYGIQTIDEEPYLAAFEPAPAKPRRTAQR